MSDKAVFEVETQYSSKGAANALGALNKYRKSLSDLRTKIDKSVASGAGVLSRNTPVLGNRKSYEQRFSGKQRSEADEKNAARFDNIMSGKGGSGFLHDVMNGNGLVGRLAQVGAAMAVWEAATTAVGMAFGFVKSSVELVVGSVFRLGEALVSTMAHFFDFGQRSKLAFSTLLGDSELGAQTFKDVRQLAQNLGVDIESTTDSYRQLLAAQFSVKDATNLTKATADLQAIGASADHVKHALLAITQIKMKGKLQAEELTRQLANAGVSSELVYQEIEKSLFGKSDKETRKKVLAMQQSGDISADVAIPAIMEAIKRKTKEQNLGDVSSQFANEKISGMLGQMSGMYKNFFTDIADDIEGPITRVAKFLFETMKSIATSPLIVNLRHALGDAFVSVAELIKKAWPAVAPLVVGAIVFITNALSSFTSFMQDLQQKNNFEALSEKVATIATVLFITGQIMVGVTGIVIRLSGAVIGLVEAFERLAKSPLARTLIGAAGGLLSSMPGLGMASTFAQGALGVGNIMTQGRSDLSSIYNTGQNAQLGGGSPLAAGEGELGGVLADINSRKSGITGIGGTITNKSIGNVNTNINIDTLDLEDPAGAGGKIADIFNRSVSKMLDEGA